MNMTEFYRQESKTFDLDGTYKQARHVMDSVLKITSNQNVIAGIVGINDLYDSDTISDGEYYGEAYQILMEHQATA